MRGLRIHALLGLLLGLIVLQAAHAEIIDRMVAAVDGKLITASDIRKERQIRTALGDTPGDDSEILQSLIETVLVEEQIAQFPGIDVSEKEIDDRLQQQPNLQGAPIADLRKAMERQIQRSKYFDLRFRQFIQVDDETLQKYYTDVFLPEVKQRGITAVPAFESVATLIRSNVIDEEMARKVAEWLADLRKRSTVEIFQ